MTDQAGIRRLLALYVRAHDGRDSGGYARLFADGGRYTNSAGEHFVGRETIRAHMAELYARRPADDRQKHLFSNSVIEVCGESAEVTSDVLTYESSGDGPWRVSMVGQCLDRLERRAGQWLFTDRRFVRQR